MPFLNKVFQPTIIISLCLYLYCIINPSSEESINENRYSYPLAVGNYWSYRSITQWGDSVPDTIFIETIIDSLEITSENDTLYKFIHLKINNTGITDTSISYYFNTDSGLYLCESTPGGIDPLFKTSSSSQLPPSFSVSDKALLLVPYNLTEGKIWTYYTYFDSISDSGGVNVRKDTTTLNRTYVGDTAILSPAGTFECIEIRSNAIACDREIHFYSSIGLIRKDEYLDSMEILEWQNNQIVPVGYIQIHECVELISWSFP
jgi:hypothetical protein